MTQELVFIPKPGTALTAAGIVQLERKVIAILPQTTDMETLQTWRDQAAALEAYLRSKDLQRPMLGAQRRIEARIGELLGEPRPGQRTDIELLRMRNSSAIDRRADRSDFRTLARGADILNDEEWRKSRRALVALVRNKLGIIPETPALPAGQYQCIFADPPWRYDFSESSTREIENQYPTMPIEEICALPISDLAHDDCVLFLWATSPKLPEALATIKAWGFVYKTCAIWDKEIIGMGYYFRQRHELLLVATKGRISAPDPSARPPSIFCERRGKHSSKPEIAYLIIEKMYPELQKVELFSRSPRIGWTAWGNETSCA